MKPQEILLASAVLALVGGGVAALATRAFLDGPVREERGVAAVEGSLTDPLVASANPELQRRIDELRISNTALLERVAALEIRLAESLSARQAVAVESQTGAAGVELAAADVRSQFQSGLELTPAFLESVDAALQRIEAREAAEREVERKQQRAERIEERLKRLQEELGLNSKQTTDMRTALLTQEQKREALFESMEDGGGDRREMRESFRTIRDETYAALESILTPDQLAAYRQSEESEFGRRGFGGDGPPGGPPDGFGRGGR
jgi:hypothetical protein